ncbi:unnamed protein product [Dibothriocephalus latus]|uniref:Uncharacterized protein n=1 Tax=Dibothriocephalus latus TaxID=60516 RepID=A0A3P7QR30_DIBLA|nr:unnamed protein product [Dibothriocephalus latus]
MLWRTEDDRRLSDREMSASPRRLRRYPRLSFIAANAGGWEVWRYPSRLSTPPERLASLCVVCKVADG